ncbi:interleukin-12 subunit beta isoform X2 [Xiphias gladius]|uniref:interleukin-12 subunit beta isoform X2 n=1 Tax=Xiphias gladius TaxID=8245 RepID=UPI001A98EE5D|nr:interleukin-12 subunit beta isoform X2 [Xiphias gladius]
MTLPLWIFGLLLIGPTGAHRLNHFPENFVVAKRGEENTVTLTCSTKINQTVTWIFEHFTTEHLGDRAQQDGQNLKLSDVDTPMLGEYSCWRGEEMLSSTHLLLEALEEDELDSLINCSANSYDCKFSCNWTNPRYTVVRLGLGHDCSEGVKSCHWVNSSNQTQDGGFQFQLSHSLSPYAEESTKLELTAEAIINDSFLRRTKRFYLRDIIKPEIPQVVTCQEVDQDLNVTIYPPPSWSTPHSFFSLEHQIEYRLQDDGKFVFLLCDLSDFRLDTLHLL